MRKILKSKKGVSLLEGLIALLLLAIVATGTFGVLLSTSRKSTAPDIREEMALAVERAQQMLQVYIYSGDVRDEYVILDIGSLYAGEVMGGLCDNETNGHVYFNAPLGGGDHDIKCLLPPMCDPDTSDFYYTVSTSTNTGFRKDMRASDKADTSSADELKVTFSISCNGYTL